MRPVLVLLVALALAMAAEPAVADPPPRKVVVGTVRYDFWRPYPGLEARTAELVGLIERVHAAAQAKYGRPADLVVLPEEALTAGNHGPADKRCIPFTGAVREAFAAVARKHNSYLVLPMDLREDERLSNALLLIGRDGAHLGTYRKVHLVYDEKTLVREGGMTPAWDAPVFDTDFGRIGLQVCWDIEYEQGWRRLEEQGAKLVLWSSMSPVTVMPRLRAMTHGYYIVSSQWRENATVFEPTGVIAAQIKPPEQVLVHELDLSFAVLGWSPPLEDGKAFTKRYGDRIGYRYYREEDCGIFWSNDPQLPIGQAVRELGLTELPVLRKRWRNQYESWWREKPTSP